MFSRELKWRSAPQTFFGSARTAREAASWMPHRGCREGANVFLEKFRPAIIVNTFLTWRDGSIPPDRAYFPLARASCLPARIAGTPPEPSAEPRI